MSGAPGPELFVPDPRLEAALAKPSTLTRWLEFVGGAEFMALAPILRGMRLAELLHIPPSGLAKLGMLPLTARRLSDELHKLRNVLIGGSRAPPWLLPLLSPRGPAPEMIVSQGDGKTPVPTAQNFLASARPASARPASARPASAHATSSSRPAAAQRPASARPPAAGGSSRLVPTAPPATRAAPQRAARPWSASASAPARPAPRPPARLGGHSPVRPSSAKHAPRPTRPRPARPLSARPALERTTHDHAGRPPAHQQEQFHNAQSLQLHYLLRPATDGSGAAHPRRQLASPRASLRSAPRALRPAPRYHVQQCGRPRSARQVSPRRAAECGGSAGAHGAGGSPRGGRYRGGSFSTMPPGALQLVDTPVAERPTGLLGAVLRREAAIAAMKTAVQIEPPTDRAGRLKAQRLFAAHIAEFRTTTADAVELLASRPENAPRFYWNGMDLALKMLTDLQWAPLPQILDPLLWKWFGHWSRAWDIKGSGPSDEAPISTELLRITDQDFIRRLRSSEKKLLALAHKARDEGAGTGRWAAKTIDERAVMLFKVQQHRLSAAHSEGGANHAQRRRFTNMEMLLYGRPGCHVLDAGHTLNHHGEQQKQNTHLAKVVDFCHRMDVRAALCMQSAWRMRKRLSARKAAADRQLAKGGSPNASPEQAPRVDNDSARPAVAYARRGSRRRSTTAPKSTAAPRSGSTTAQRSGGADPERRTSFFKSGFVPMDRSFLNEAGLSLEAAAAGEAGGEAAGGTAAAAAKAAAAVPPPAPSTSGPSRPTGASRSGRPQMGRGGAALPDLS